jgi:peptidoglycan/LPS O-acetylase OafA/YrhL
MSHAGNAPNTPRPIAATAAGQPAAGNLATPRIPALDGIRGLAILFVLLWHYFPFTKPFFPGWAGVDLFFVLSGYLITGRLLATIGRSHYFSAFYRNRILRIFPLYYALITAFFLGATFLVRPVNQPHFTWYLQHWPGFFCFTQNWTMIIHGVPENLTLAPLWSLAVEEQFYLFWPLVILLTRNAATRIKGFSIGILLVLIGRTILYLQNPASAEYAYVNTFLRMDSLLMGSLLCQLHHTGIKINQRWVITGMTALAGLMTASCISLGDVQPYNAFFSTAGYSLLALFFAALLHLAVQPTDKQPAKPQTTGTQTQNNPVTPFLNSTFLRFCGRISYCLYLIHFPVLIIIGTWLSIHGQRRWPEYTPVIRWGSLLVSLLLSFGLSALSYRYFETIFLRFKSRLS